MTEKRIRIVKLDCQYACGWGVQADGSILVEIDKPSWERLEEKLKRRDGSPDLDFDLAETILQRFNEV